MLALCLMLLGTYYAQNYAGIIGRSLQPTHSLRHGILEVLLSLVLVMLPEQTG